jgi:hypothetical protein
MLFLFRLKESATPNGIKYKKQRGRLLACYLLYILTIVFGVPVLSVPQETLEALFASTCV